jgi:hypothetical protein
MAKHPVMLVATAANVSIAAMVAPVVNVKRKNKPIKAKHRNR